MSISESEQARIEELFQTIEHRKPHENAAPTYKDSAALREMAELVLRPREWDVETLEQLIPALWYLTESYDQMGRAGVSAELYMHQLNAHVCLRQLRTYSDEENGQLENCFFLAVKARNFYEPDDCCDLVALVTGYLPDETIRTLLDTARQERRDSIHCDPVEKTAAYLAVIDEVEQKIDEAKTMDFCLESWNLKASFLAEYGICWRSPAELNPGVMFD